MSKDIHEVAEQGEGLGGPGSEAEKMTQELSA